MTYKTKRILSILLSVISAGGVIVTGYLVAIETPKAMKKIDELKSSKKDIKKIEYVKSLIPIYWPAIAVGTGTIGSVIGSQILSQKAEASLIATSTMLSQGWRRYKGKVKDIFGIDADKTITNLIASDDYSEKDIPHTKDLFWEEHLGFFTCKKEDLMGAINDINQRLHTPDPDPEGTIYWTTLYFFVKDANAKVLDKTKLEASKEIGWTTDYLCEVYELGCMWVHPLFTRVIKKETGEVLFTKISFFEEPIFLEESERSRYHYKSRADYEHEAEIDMHDADALALYSHGYQDLDPLEIENELVNSKPDCDIINDNGRRFIPTNQVVPNVYLDEDPELPSEKDIPSKEVLK